jgi:hypothetical protein
MTGDSGNVQDAWVRDIKQFKHRCFVTVTPSGWSNDDAGLGWLQQVFDKKKLRPQLVASGDCSFSTVTAAL